MPKLRIGNKLYNTPVGDEAYPADRTVDVAPPIDWSKFVLEPPSGGPPPPDQLNLPLIQRQQFNSRYQGESMPRVGGGWTVPALGGEIELRGSAQPGLPGSGLRNALPLDYDLSLGYRRRF